MNHNNKSNNSSAWGILFTIVWLFCSAIFAGNSEELFNIPSALAFFGFLYGVPLALMLIAWSFSALFINKKGDNEPISKGQTSCSKSDSISHGGDYDRVTNSKPSIKSSNVINSSYKRSSVSLLGLSNINNQEKLDTNGPFTVNIDQKDKEQEKLEIFLFRKNTLDKMIKLGDFESDNIRQSLIDEIKSFTPEISSEQFQELSKKIRNFIEKKHKVDNHIKYEGRLSNSDIQSIKKYHGYVCMACGLNPVKEWGDNMKGILEAHHRNPFAEMEDDQMRTLVPEDFLILCPNCHRMIHKLEDPSDLDKLKKLLFNKFLSD